MFAAAVAAKELTPTIKLAELSARLNLDQTLPAAFGEWRLDPVQPVAIINPVQDENIRRIYDQTLSRTYVSPAGYRIMLSVAYGTDQRSGVALAVHYPDVCYSAQGFDILSTAVGSISTEHGVIPVGRVETKSGPTRPEPLTYWITLGDHITLGGMDRRLIELRYGLERKIPDGLVFRVSSIDADSAKAFRLQEQFIKDLIGSLPQEGRIRIAGARRNQAL